MPCLVPTIQIAPAIPASRKPFAKWKKLHVEISENSRREFLRNAGRLGLGLGIGGGLLATPMAASALTGEDAAHQFKEIERNKALLTGKANRFTILHTADIHAQLLVHDEFFIENSKVVYKKGEGWLPLKP